MAKRNAILPALFLFLSLVSFSQKNPENDRLRRIILTEGQAEVVIAYPGRTEIDQLTRNVSVYSVHDGKVKISLSPLTVDWFLARKYDYSIVERAAHKGIITASGLSQAMQWETYPSYTQYDSIMRHFHTAWPGLCVLDTIGTSINGRLVLALKISDNCEEKEAEPSVFYSSTIHGNETGGFILMLRLADYLLENYLSDDRIRNLVDNLEIWINPLANPDGTYRSGNAIVAPLRYNSAGYDLNRNFPDPLLTNTVRQKETEDMMNFLQKNRFSLSANFHSGEEVINYPWDRWPYMHADSWWFYQIGRAWADTAHKYARKGYMDFMDNGVTNGYDWYPVYGGRQDYVTYDLRGREVTVELDTNFITPAADLEDLWEYNYRSMLGYLENALFGIRGIITDAVTGKPLAAKITIDSHDTGDSFVMSDSVTGFYVRFLTTGSYDLRFEAENYNDTVLYDILVRNRESTDLSVELVPEKGTDPPKVKSPLFYPNPAEEFVNMVLPDNMTGSIRISVYNSSGIKVADYKQVSSGTLLEGISVSHLPPGLYHVLFRNQESGLNASGSFLVIRDF